MSSRPESFSAFDGLLAASDETSSPWIASAAGRRYEAHFDLLHRMLAIPIAAGDAERSESGRTVKALDAWIAHELRRAGFSAFETWPRSRQPRVLPPEFELLERAADRLRTALEEAEAVLLQPMLSEAASRASRTAKPQLRPRALRSAITATLNAVPGTSGAQILGRYYVKQVDVGIGRWQRGPEVLISTKSQFSSYANNRNNRYEETLGEITNLKDRYPLAACGYAFLVRSNIREETGALANLRDLLLRLRQPDGPYAATMLLVADWDNDTLECSSVTDGDPQLTASQFFDDLIASVLRNTPIGVHTEVRRRRGDLIAGGVVAEPGEEDPFAGTDLDEEPVDGDRE